MEPPPEYLCPIGLNIMEDPVICEDGHTYERETILEWFKNRETSPLTNLPISTKLIPNVALRSAIETFLQGPAKQEKVVIDTVQEQCVIQPKFTCQDKDLIVVFVPPAEYQCLETSYIVAVDVSQSMLEPAGKASSEGDAFSRLDLIKHALRSLVATLSERDQFCLISFSNTASVVYELQTADKRQAAAAINKLQAGGQTNIYDAARLVFEQQQKCGSRKTVSILLTDGQPTVEPPRGTLQTIQRYVATGNARPIACFGVGYQLDGRLLYEISKATGGWYSFISDQSMLGTVFVNYWAAQRAVCAEYVIAVNGKRQQIEVICGVPRKIRFLDVLHGDNIKVLIEQGEKGVEYMVNKVSDWEQNPVIPVLLELEKIPTLKYDVAKARMLALADKVKSLHPDFQDDYSHDDEYKGQLTKSVETEEIFKKWGANHIFQFVRAHSLQVCTNFKDASIQRFVSDQMAKYQDIFEKIYCGIPVMKHVQIEKASEVRINAQMSYNAAIPTYLYDACGGCIAGGCQVQLIDGGYKQIKNLVKGDKLNNGAVVQAIVVSQAPDHLYSRGSLMLTDYHPIQIANKWVFPINVLSKISCSDLNVYNVVLDSVHKIEIGGISVATLGHGFNEDIVKHDYFGSKILGDLAKLKGYNDGKVHVKNWIRGVNGLVCGLE